MAATAALVAAANRRFRPFEIQDVSGIVEAIGSKDVADALFAYFDGLLGVDYCVVYQLRKSSLMEMGSASGEGAAESLKSDIRSYDVKRQFSLAKGGVHIDVATVYDEDDAHIHRWFAVRRQRIIICARRPSGAYCIGIVRSAQRPPVGEAEIEALNQVAMILLAAVARHCELIAQRPSLVPALRSLSDIENRLESRTSLSRREREVCARILFGLSTCGIALDLGIGKESVTTYRKRSYQRLGIGSQRELLMLFLSVCSCSADDREDDTDAPLN